MMTALWGINRYNFNCWIELSTNEIIIKWDLFSLTAFGKWVVG